MYVGATSLIETFAKRLANDDERDALLEDGYPVFFQKGVKSKGFSTIVNDIKVGT